MAAFGSINSKNINYPVNPRPQDNSAGFVTPYKLASGAQRGAQMLGGPNLLSDSANTRILVKDATKPRVIMGKIGTGINDYGLKVSKDGFDVTTATNDQLIFNSSQNVFKIVLSGTTSFSKGANVETASISVPHNLSYVPLITAYYAVSGVYAPFGTVGVAFGVGADNGKITRASFATVDTTNMNFQIVTPNYASNGNYSSAESYTVRYYLLQETAN